MRPVPVVLRRVALRPQLSAQPRRVSEQFANNNYDNATPTITRDDGHKRQVAFATSPSRLRLRVCARCEASKQASKRRDLTEVKREERSAICARGDASSARTLSQASGRIAARGASSLLDVVRAASATTAQRVGLGVPLTEAGGTLGLEWMQQQQQRTSSVSWLQPPNHRARELELGARSDSREQQQPRATASIDIAKR